MDSHPHNQVHEVFDEAVELPIDRRAQALNQLCGNNAELRSAVESLLRAYDMAGDFLADPHIAPEYFTQSESYPPGTRIDRYVLLQRIGVGGHGTVYLAEQDPPLRRRVALKVIKQEMATPQVISRFDLERQALATMDHPNIAKVFDAGTTETGNPYFVMELIEGKPITEFCREFSLDLGSRLSIFATVCKAVHHAHQKGIIHRDLKPSNILLALKDGLPFPTVIDFGVARSLEPGDDTEAPSLHFFGTPQYMSPEQASMRGVAVDWRSDIYSLGAVLYELVTDVPPFEAKQFEGASYAEICRVVREVEPPSRAGNMQGILDSIIAKAMNKKPERRHQSAEALGHDIGCYLADASAQVSSQRVGRVQGKLRWRMASGLFLLFAATVAVIVAAWRGTDNFAASPDSLTQPMFTMDALAPGLTAELYESAFNGLVTTRIDGEINFSWERGESPAPGMRAPRYSIRWRGILVVPGSGASYLGIRANDAAQVYVDGQLALSFDRPSRAIMDRQLPPGQHKIQVEYRNIQAEGHAILFWKRPGGEEEKVPASALFHAVDEPAAQR